MNPSEAANRRALLLTKGYVAKHGKWYYEVSMGEFIGPMTMRQAWDDMEEEELDDMEQEERRNKETWIPSA